MATSDWLWWEPRDGDWYSSSSFRIFWGWNIIIWTEHLSAFVKSFLQLRNLNLQIDSFDGNGTIPDGNEFQRMMRQVWIIEPSKVAVPPCFRSISFRCCRVLQISPFISRFSGHKANPPGTWSCLKILVHVTPFYSSWNFSSDGNQQFETKKNLCRVDPQVYSLLPHLVRQLDTDGRCGFMARVYANKRDTAERMAGSERENQRNTWWMYKRSKVSQSWDVHSNSLSFAQRMKCLLKVDADFSVVGRFSSCSGNNGAVSSQSWKRCRCVGGWKDEHILTLSFLFLSCSFPKRAFARGVLTSKVRVGLRRLMPLCWPWPLAFKCQLLKGGFHHFVNDLIFKICNGNIILYIYILVYFISCKLLLSLLFSPNEFSTNTESVCFHRALPSRSSWTWPFVDLRRPSMWMSGDLCCLGSFGAHRLNVFNHVFFWWDKGPLFGPCWRQTLCWWFEGKETQIWRS